MTEAINAHKKMAMGITEGNVMKKGGKVPSMLQVVQSLNLKPQNFLQWVTNGIPVSTSMQARQKLQR